VTVTVAGPGPLVAEARAETTPGDARPGDNHAAVTVGVRTAAAGAAGARHSADAVVGPALRGAARVGRRLTVLPGTGWKGGGPHRFVVRWQRCRLTGGLRCVTLGARRGRLLALTRADVGMRLRAVVFAVSSDGIRQRRVTRPSAPVRNRARAVAVRSTAVARPLPVRRSG
jgi:hypothetical protein